MPNAGIRDRVVGLRRVRAGDLVPHPKNFRRHPDRQRTAMGGVLREIGYAGALIVREAADGGLVLLDGHLRAETTPDAVVPVLVVDLDEHEADLFLATFDAVSGLAELDQELFRALTAGLVPQDQDTAALIRTLQEELAGATPQPVVEDEVPEPPADPITRLGDLWLLGKHRLLCGDATKADDVARLLGARKPVLMVTDPPYGVEYDADWRNHALRSDGSPIGGRAIGKVVNDDRADWREAWEQFRGDVAYVWHAGNQAHVVAESLIACDLQIRSQIVWAKNQLVIGRGDYHPQHEPCWYCVRTGKPGLRTDDRTQTTLWQIDKPHKSETGHSAQKPVECMARAIRNHDADAVYDPFLGSGTTLIAAEQLGRVCYGLEISPAYCDVIVQRWETFTGKKARRHA